MFCDECGRPRREPWHYDGRCVRLRDDLVGIVMLVGVIALAGAVVVLSALWAAGVIG